MGSYWQLERMPLSREEMREMLIQQIFSWSHFICYVTEIEIYEMKFLRAGCVAVYMIWAGFHLKCRDTFACLFW